MGWFNLNLMTKPRFSVCSHFWQINPLTTSSFSKSWQRCDSPAHVALSTSLPLSLLQRGHTARTVSVLSIPFVTPIQSVWSSHQLSGNHLPTYWTALVLNSVFSSAIHLFLGHFTEMQVSKILSLSLIWKSRYFIKDKGLVRALKYLFSSFFKKSVWSLDSTITELL